MLIPFSQLLHKYKLHVTGIIHMGANEGQEVEDYVKNGINDMILIEAIPDVAKALKKRMECTPAFVLQACLSDVDGQKIKFNVSSHGGQSSSMFEFGTHEKQHPEVKFVDSIELTTTRADTLLSPFMISYFSRYNFLNLDLQGAELKALKGMGKLLHFMDYVYTEINGDELYKGCARFDEIERFLAFQGFVRMEAVWTEFGWGDAFYIKQKLR